MVYQSAKLCVNFEVGAGVWYRVTEVPASTLRSLMADVIDADVIRFEQWADELQPGRAAWLAETGRTWRLASEFEVTLLETLLGSLDRGTDDG